MAYEVTIKEIAPRETYVYRGRIRLAELRQTLADKLPKAFGRVLAEGRKPMSQPFTRFLKVEGDEAEIEAGLAVSAAVSGQSDFAASRLPGGRAAVTSHFGSYDRLGEADAAVGDWLRAQGLEPASAPWHLYVSDPSCTPPEKVETQVFFPLSS